MDEALLIQQILEGDTAAFRFLYKTHSTSAWRLAYSICKQKPLAEEALQNSFVSAYKYLNKFRAESSFKTWLLRIVFNESIRVQQTEKKYQWHDLPQEVGSEGSMIMSVPDHSNQQAMKDKVQQVMKELNEKEAVVMNLFYLESLSVKEVAQILNYEEGNVKVLLHRARKSFKLIYEKM